MNYDKRQISSQSRRYNDITACKVVEVDKGRGLIYQLPWKNDTSWIKPSNFEIEPYKVGDWIDMILITVSSQNRISLKSAQFIGRTPEAFIPEE